jgi:hypothetical protein
LADEELGGGDAVGGGGGGAGRIVDLAEELFEGELGEVGEVGGDGGEGRGGEFGHADVVEAGDADVVGDAEAVVVAGFDDGEGGEVVEGDDGGRGSVPFNEGESGLVAVGDGAVDGEEQGFVEFEAGLLHDGAEGFVAGEDVGAGHAAVAEGDAAVAEGKKVVGEEVGAFLVVDGDGGDHGAGDGANDGDEGDVGGGPEFEDVGVAEVAVGVDDDDSVDGLGDLVEELDGVGAALVGEAATGPEGVIGGVGEEFFEGGDALDGEGIGDVVGDDGDGAGAAGLEGLGGAVGDVVEAAGDFEDLAAAGVADANGGVVEDARNAAMGDPRQASNIGNRDRQRLLLRIGVQFEADDSLNTRLFTSIKNGGGECKAI